MKNAAFQEAEYQFSHVDVSPAGHPIKVRICDPPQDFGLKGECTGMLK